MTANELADKLEKVSNDMEHSYVVNDWKLLFESALVLRKQAKEIAMLKQIIDANNLQSDIGQFIRPIDEPVAWIDPKELNMDVSTSVNKNKMFDKDIPLYTHPAKELDEQFKEGFEVGKEEGWKAHKFHHPAKTLTDGEILNIYLEQTNGNKDLDILEFARFILKKASEK